MAIANIRQRIDEIDLELLALLEERMELGLRARRFKKECTDRSREEVVLNRAMRSSLALVEPEFAERLFVEIISQSKQLQERDECLVAFQGEHGAYSEEASRRLVPDAAYIPCFEFANVFTGVAEGAFDLGVVPVENSLEGAVTQVNDLLTTTDLKVVGEARLPVRHNLLARAGMDLRDIRVVYSHPQALAQCRGFLAKHELEARPFYDTAGAAKMIAKDRPRAAAAISSSLASELYGLEILESEIEDDASNTTRFLMLARRSVEGGNKCSIVLVTAHEAGQLFACLRLFADSNINLTRIASMPLRSDPDNYSFFLDFEGSDESPMVRKVLDGVSEIAVDYRFLGCYPSANGIS